LRSWETNDDGVKVQNLGRKATQMGLAEERGNGTRERGRTTPRTKAAGMTRGRRLVAKIP
jgi:hypothetical protein